MTMNKFDAPVDALAFSNAAEAIRTTTRGMDADLERISPLQWDVLFGKNGVDHGKFLVEHNAVKAIASLLDAIAEEMADAVENGTPTVTLVLSTDPNWDEKNPAPPQPADATKDTLSGGISDAEFQKNIAEMLNKVLSKSR